MSAQAWPSVLVLGAEGLLGHRLARTLRGEGYTILAADRTMAPAEDDLALAGLLEVERPDVVINCIGWVRQRALEGRRAEAIYVNAVLPHRLSARCKSLGIDLVHISTDCVHDQDWYGASKMLGEAIEHGVVLRTSFIGHELARKAGLLEWTLSQRGTVNGYARALWNGLTSNELAKVIARFVLHDLEALQGIVWEICGPDITKLQLLELINEVYGCGLEIRPVDEPVTDRRLDGWVFAERFGYAPPSWREMLQQMKHAQSAAVGIDYIEHGRAK